MAPQDWNVLRKIGMHTLNNGSAILSFVLLSYLIKQFVTDDTLGMVLDTIEGGVLIVLVLMFAGQVIYDVAPEKIREFVSSKFVFA